jgi:hypothetical protein
MSTIGELRKYRDGEVPISSDVLRKAKNAHIDVSKK